VAGRERHANCACARSVRDTHLIGLTKRNPKHCVFWVSFC
jgi:hypothetical protein